MKGAMETMIELMITLSEIEEMFEDFNDEIDSEITNSKGSHMSDG
ncbi:hypothetical protein R9X47_08850 [Wukongibacter baidiensis]